MLAMSMALANPQGPGGYTSILGASALAVWDAERADLITQAGGVVSSWRDVVGAKDAAQATGASQPAYSATGLNGRPALVFDGVDDFLNLESTTGLPTGASPCEIWALVGQSGIYPGDSGVRTLLRYGSTSANNSRGLFRATASGASAGSLGTGTGAASVSVSDTGVVFEGNHVVRGVVTATDAAVYVDGGAGTTAAAVSATGTARVRIGGSTASTPTQYWFGPVNLLAITSPLSAGQAAAFLAFLKQRGGVA